MKRFITAILILVFAAAASICGDLLLKNSASSIHELLEAALSTSQRTGDIGAATKKVLAEMDKDEWIFLLTAPKDDHEELEGLIYRLSSCAQSGDLKLFKAICSQALEKTQMMVDSVKLKNIV